LREERCVHKKYVDFDESSGVDVEKVKVQVSFINSEFEAEEKDGSDWSRKPV
jgi:hypothetical protein